MDLFEELTAFIKKFLEEESNTSDPLGTLDLCVEVFERILQFITDEAQSKKKIFLMRDAFKDLERVICKREIQIVFLLNCIQKCFDTITEEPIESWAKKEILFFCSRITEQITVSKRAQIKNCIKPYSLIRLIDLVPSTGNYDLQANIIETIFRIYGKDHLQTIQQSFPDSPHLSERFLEINTDNFDEDLRMFLHTMNTNYNKVFSIVVKAIALDRIEFKLNNKLWVDFNLIDYEISWYCDRNALGINKNGSSDPSWEIVTAFLHDIIKSDVESTANGEFLIKFQMKSFCLMQTLEAHELVKEARTLKILIEKSEESTHLIKNILPQYFRTTTRTTIYPERPTLFSNKVYKPIKHRISVSTNRKSRSVTSCNDSTLHDTSSRTGEKSVSLCTEVISIMSSSFSSAKSLNRSVSLNSCSSEDLLAPTYSITPKTKPAGCISKFSLKDYEKLKVLDLSSSEEMIKVKEPRKKTARKKLNIFEQQKERPKDLSRIIKKIKETSRSSCVLSDSDSANTMVKNKNTRSRRDTLATKVSVAQTQPVKEKNHKPTELLDEAIEIDSDSQPIYIVNKTAKKISTAVVKTQKKTVPSNQMCFLHDKSAEKIALHTSRFSTPIKDTPVGQSRKNEESNDSRKIRGQRVEFSEDNVEIIEDKEPSMTITSEKQNYPTQSQAFTEVFSDDIIAEINADFESNKVDLGKKLVPEKNLADDISSQETLTNKRNKVKADRKIENNASTMEDSDDMFETAEDMGSVREEKNKSISFRYETMETEDIGEQSKKMSKGEKKKDSPLKVQEINEKIAEMHIDTFNTSKTFKPVDVSNNKISKSYSTGENSVEMLEEPVVTNKMTNEKKKSKKLTGKEKRSPKFEDGREKSKKKDVTENEHFLLIHQTETLKAKKDLSRITGKSIQMEKKSKSRSLESKAQTSFDKESIIENEERKKSVESFKKSTVKPSKQTLAQTSKDAVPKEKLIKAPKQKEQGMILPSTGPQPVVHSHIDNISKENALFEKPNKGRAKQSNDLEKPVSEENVTQTSVETASTIVEKKTVRDPQDPIWSQQTVVHSQIKPNQDMKDNEKLPRKRTKELKENLAPKQPFTHEEIKKATSRTSKKYEIDEDDQPLVVTVSKKSKPQIPSKKLMRKVKERNKLKKNIKKVNIEHFGDITNIQDPSNDEKHPLSQKSVEESNVFEINSQEIEKPSLSQRARLRIRDVGKNVSYLDEENNNENVGKSSDKEDDLLESYRNLTKELQENARINSQQMSDRLSDDRTKLSDIDKHELDQIETSPPKRDPESDLNKSLRRGNKEKKEKAKKHTKEMDKSEASKEKNDTAKSGRDSKDKLKDDATKLIDAGQHHLEEMESSSSKRDSQLDLSELINNVNEPFPSLRKSNKEKKEKSKKGKKDNDKSEASKENNDTAKSGRDSKDKLKDDATKLSYADQHHLEEMESSPCKRDSQLDLSEQINVNEPFPSLRKSKEKPKKSKKEKNKFEVSKENNDGKATQIDSKDKSQDNEKITQKTNSKNDTDQHHLEEIEIDCRKETSLPKDGLELEALIEKVDLNEFLRRGRKEKKDDTPIKEQLQAHDETPQNKDAKVDENNLSDKDHLLEKPVEYDPEFEQLIEEIESNDSNLAPRQVKNKNDTSKKEKSKAKKSETEKHKDVTSAKNDDGNMEPEEIADLPKSLSLRRTRKVINYAESDSLNEDEQLMADESLKKNIITVDKVDNKESTESENSSVDYSHIKPTEKTKLLLHQTRLLTNATPERRTLGSPTYTSTPNSETKFADISKVFDDMQNKNKSIISKLKENDREYETSLQNVEEENDELYQNLAGKNAKIVEELDEINAYVTPLRKNKRREVLEDNANGPDGKRSKKTDEDKNNAVATDETTKKPKPDKKKVPLNDEIEVVKESQASFGPSKRDPRLKDKTPVSPTLHADINEEGILKIITAAMIHGDPKNVKVNKVPENRINVLQNITLKNRADEKINQHNPDEFVSFTDPHVADEHGAVNATFDTILHSKNNTTFNKTTLSNTTVSRRRNLYNEGDMTHMENIEEDSVENRRREKLGISVLPKEKRDRVEETMEENEKVEATVDRIEEIKETGVKKKARKSRNMTLKRKWGADLESELEDTPVYEAEVTFDEILEAFKKEKGMVTLSPESKPKRARKPKITTTPVKEKTLLEKEIEELDYDSPNVLEKLRNIRRFKRPTNPEDEIPIKRLKINVHSNLEKNNNDLDAKSLKGEEGNIKDTRSVAQKTELESTDVVSLENQVYGSETTRVFLQHIKSLTKNIYLNDRIPKNANDKKVLRSILHAFK